MLAAVFALLGGGRCCHAFAPPSGGPANLQRKAHDEHLHVLVVGDVAVHRDPLGHVVVPIKDGALWLHNMFKLSALATNGINFGTEKIRGGWGWCVSLVLTFVPTGLPTLGTLFDLVSPFFHVPLSGPAGQGPP